MLGELIDLSPSVHELGGVEVDIDSTKLAIDLTHYKGDLYLSMVDCHPRRFAIGREICADIADNITGVPQPAYERRQIGLLLRPRKIPPEMMKPLFDSNWPLQRRKG